MIKIILAEGHNVVRNGIKALLEKENDIEVIAEAGNGEKVLELLNEGQNPHIIITAINMAPVTGFELLTRVKQIHPHIKVIILSRMDGIDNILHAFKSGATGYMLKSIEASELIYGIRHVAATNERYLCNEVALTLLDKLLHSAVNNSNIDAANIDMSNREIEVLSLVSQGFTNQEIADKLFTSKRTIESHRQNLVEKTGTRNTAALIRYAVLNRIIG
ncbi:MAG: response regulator transcription factor [Bacteroidota bacterium]